MNIFLKHLPLILLALVLDVLDIILFLIAIAGSITVIISITTILLNIFQSIFVMIFWFIILIVNDREKTKELKNDLRKVLIIITSLIGESFPLINDIIGILPLNTLGVLLVISDEIKIIDKLLMKTSQATLFNSFINKINFSTFRFFENLEKNSGGRIKNFSKINNSDTLPKIISSSKITTENETKVPHIKKYKVIEKFQIAILLLFFFPFFAFAQSNKVILIPSTQEGRLIISAIFINQKTKTLFEYPQKSYYIWETGGLGANYFETRNPILVIKIKPDFSVSKIKVKLTVVLPNLKREVYQGEVDLPKQDVAIIKKVKNYFELPFVGTYSPGEIIVAKPYNFSSNNLSFIWNMNDLFLSNSPSINSSLLRTGYLILRVKNQDNFFESASEFLIIK